MKFVNDSVNVYVPGVSSLFLMVTRLLVDEYVVLRYVNRGNNCVLDSDECVTLQLTRVHKRPAEPDDCVGSNTMSSQEPIDDAADNATVGTMGFAAACTVTMTELAYAHVTPIEQGALMVLARRLSLYAPVGTICSGFVALPSSVAVTRESVVKTQDELEAEENTNKYEHAKLLEGFGTTPLPLLVELSNVINN
jgi:hypothetical protein